MDEAHIKELLGREEINLDMSKSYSQLKEKTILVTGGGGFIGSELCRQIAECKPKKLIVFDIYENTTYELELELREKHPELDLSICIGSVQDTARIDQIFEKYRPDVVYHAAAHKHVPIMENSPNEAIKNNVFGTYWTACAALKYGTQEFVLISTDKAVNPTGIMGASKRVCEMLIECMNSVVKENCFNILPFTDISKNGASESETHFTAVRFGNVFGSSGSVIPRFEEQIKSGRSVTVTDPEADRYFITVREAVNLVLEVGNITCEGDVFVLDMGDPVNIDSLARNLIRLHGYEPDKEMKIIYTGLRPGERLHEVDMLSQEDIEKTENSKIYMEKRLELDIEKFFGQMKNLYYACYNNDSDIVHIVEDIVPSFHPVGDNRVRT